MEIQPQHHQWRATTAPCHRSKHRGCLALWSATSPAALLSCRTNLRRALADDCHRSRNRPPPSGGGTQTAAVSHVQSVDQAAATQRHQAQIPVQLQARLRNQPGPANQCRELFAPSLDARGPADASAAASPTHLAPFPPVARPHLGGRGQPLGIGRART